MRQGYDISEWQTDVDWSNVITDFIYIRATSGYRGDKKFADHWNRARMQKIPRGAYWYLIGDRPLSDQFAIFTRTVNPNDKGELPPMLDVEDKTLATIPSDQIVGVIIAALQALDQWWGKGGTYGNGEHASVLYTYPDFMHSRLHNDRALQPWHLDWSNLGNNIEPPWPLTIRQFAVEAQPGFPAPIDVNDMSDTAWESLIGKVDADVLNAAESKALTTIADLMQQLQKPGALHQFDARMAALEDKADQTNTLLAQLVQNTAPAKQG